MSDVHPTPQQDKDNHADPAETTGKESNEQTGLHRIAACIDTSGFAEKVIPHALAMAAALGSPVTFLRVVEAKPGLGSPPDPVEWDIRIREAQDEGREARR